MKDFLISIKDNKTFEVLEISINESGQKKYHRFCVSDSKDISKMPEEIRDRIEKYKSKML